MDLMALILHEKSAGANCSPQLKGYSCGRMDHFYAVGLDFFQIAA
jgi:hypothetical protein